MNIIFFYNFRLDFVVVGASTHLIKTMQIRRRIRSECGLKGTHDEATMTAEELTNKGNLFSNDIVHTVCELCARDRDIIVFFLNKMDCTLQQV